MLQLLLRWYKWEEARCRLSQETTEEVVGNSSPTSLTAARFCCVEHTSLLCMTADLEKGQEGHLQFVCVAWIVPTELAVSVGDVYLCESGAVSKCRSSLSMRPISPVEPHTSPCSEVSLGALARAVFPILSLSQVLGDPAPNASPSLTPLARLCRAEQYIPAL